MPNAELCREIVRQLWPYLDGALPDDLRARVTAHLVACDTCRSHYDFERAFLDAIRLAEPHDGEFESLRVRVVTALESEGMHVS